MSRILQTVPLGVCLLARLAAQDASADAPPAFEVAASYAYNNVAIYNGPAFNQSGGSVRMESFFGRTSPQWGGHAVLSIAGEFAGSGSRSGKVFTGLAGPHWGTQWRHVLLFGGVLAGAAGTHVNGAVEEGSPPSLTRSAFSYSVDAGADFLFDKQFALEIESQDLFLRAPDPLTGKAPYSGALRVSAGIVFRFRKRSP